MLLKIVNKDHDFFKKKHTHAWSLFYHIPQKYPHQNLTFLWRSSQKTLGIFSIQLRLPESYPRSYDFFTSPGKDRTSLTAGGFSFLQGWPWTKIVIPGVNFTPLNGLVINGRNWAYNHGPCLEGRSYFTPRVTAGCFWGPPPNADQTEFSMLSCYVGVTVNLHLEEAGADAAWKDGKGGGRMRNKKHI